MYAGSMTPTLLIGNSNMEEFITDRSNYAYILLAFFAVWLYARVIKYRKLDEITSHLNARRKGNLIVGNKEHIEYMILFEDGYSGGSAVGPSAAGYKSMVRIIIEKKMDHCFELDSSQNIKNSLEDLKSKIERESISRLFELGFNKITSDGELVEISISPAMLGKNVNSQILEDAVTELVKIISSQPVRRIRKLDER